jgi:hypothetical protein
MQVLCKFKFLVIEYTFFCSQIPILNLQFFCNWKAFTTQTTTATAAATSPAKNSVHKTSQKEISLTKMSPNETSPNKMSSNKSSSNEASSNRMSPKSLNLNVVNKPFPLFKDGCKNNPNTSNLLICEDSLDIYYLVFRVQPEMASSDFQLKSSHFVQNISGHIEKCKNKGKQSSNKWHQFE